MISLSYLRSTAAAAVLCTPEHLLKTKHGVHTAVPCCATGESIQEGSGNAPNQDSKSRADAPDFWLPPCHGSSRDFLGYDGEATLHPNALVMAEPSKTPWSSIELDKDKFRMPGMPLNMWLN